MSLATLLYPELRSVPRGRRGAMLRLARRVPFDVFELLGMAVALVAAALVANAAATLFAIVVSVALAAPLCVRRNRRALRALLEAGR